MSVFRYPQFCALARAVEILGARWTFLVIRDLFSGPQRFTDLRRSLRGISSSVLSERLAQLEDVGIVTRRDLPTPAASTVYELSETGCALQPAMVELVRWGSRFLGPPEPGDQLEPSWVRLGFHALARRGPSPARCIEVRIPTETDPLILRVEGGPGGTTVHDGPGEAEVTLEAEPIDLLALAAGTLPSADALAEGRVRAKGDLSALEEFSELFDLAPTTPN